MKQERVEKLKEVTVSMSEARRVAMQTDKLSDEEFEKKLRSWKKKKIDKE